VPEIAPWLADGGGIGGNAEGIVVGGSSGAGFSLGSVRGLGFVCAPLPMSAVALGGALTYVMASGVIRRSRRSLKNALIGYRNVIDAMPMMTKT
jgi:hypothetical protein